MSERKVFTYRDVEEAKKWVGKWGYFGSVLTDVAGLTNEREVVHSILDSVVEHSAFPFEHDYQNWQQFFSPDPEPVEKWVPFTADDAALYAGKAVVKKTWNGAFSIIVATHWDTGIDEVLMFDLAPWGEDRSRGEYLSGQALLDQCTFLDGTPCGKKVTE